MKKTTFTLHASGLVLLLLMQNINGFGQGFSVTATNWNIPSMDTYEDRFNHLFLRHYVQDMNNDGLPDLIDSEDDNNAGYPWQTGNQKYWKVYLNTGTGFSSTANNWNIPGMGDMDDRFYHLFSRHYIKDMNNDGLPDLIDCEDNANAGSPWINGTQKYWKVFLNTASGFAATAINWNIPDMDIYEDRFIHLYTRHYVEDINGDGLPDLIDSEDSTNLFNPWQNGSQKYWKVYLNTGSGFAATAINWNIPGMGDMDDRFYHTYARHYIKDMNSDGLPDMIDCEDNSNLYFPWQNGSQKYWKVFLNTGAGFAATAINWNIPSLDLYEERFTEPFTRHYVDDIDGDGLPDLIDSENNANSGFPWQNGSQEYWKVFLNTGTGFATTAINWNIPGMGDMDDRYYHLFSRHYIKDMDGNGKPDLIDCEDNSNAGFPWQNGNQKFWKVFFNTSTTGLPVSQYSFEEQSIYPNPATDEVTLLFDIDNGVAHFTISDNIGRVIMEGNTKGKKTMVNINLLAKGFYYVTMCGREKEIKKLIKQ